LWRHADFFVVNVSSPNTPNLRQLQDKGLLDGILAVLQEVNREMSAEATAAESRDRREKRDGAEAVLPHPEIAAQVDDQHRFDPPQPFLKPILVKVAPDLTFTALDEMLELVVPRQVTGIVATNTTIGRPDTTDPVLAKRYSEAGGLSGKPLRERSTAVVRHLYRQTKGSLPIVGVGGIFNAADAWDKITSGACLVQIYTGLVYEGPGVVRDVLAGLLERMSAEGLTSLRQAVGISAERAGAR
jgi:dihydroorotate dehydrogenase